jgi:hypothetical protein
MQNLSNAMRAVRLFGRSFRQTNTAPSPIQNLNPGRETQGVFLLIRVMIFSCLCWKKRKKNKNKHQSFVQQLMCSKQFIHLTASHLPQISNAFLPHQREPTVIQLQHFSDLQMIYHVDFPSDSNIPIFFDTGALAPVAPLRRISFTISHNPEYLPYMV